MMMKGMQRPDPSKMAEDLFSKLDTKGQGYIEKSDLESALSKTSQSNSSSSSSVADDMFAKLDNDGDGKVTKEEMSATIQKIAALLNGPAPRMRMQNGQGGMPPPQESTSTDSTSSTQADDPADTNGDGTVSTEEALAYETAQNLSTADTSSSSSTDAQFMKQVMQLLHAYGGFDQAAENSSFSTSA